MKTEYHEGYACQRARDAIARAVAQRLSVSDEAIEAVATAQTAVREAQQKLQIRLAQISDEMLSRR